jgi:hypothetical protein
MNKLIVYNKITNYINERFDEMTIDEFTDLQAGDGTLSILDGIINDYESRGYTFNCHEIEMFADYIVDKTSKYCAAHEFDDLTIDDKNNLFQEFDSIADGFAEMCIDQGCDYDDQDEWLNWLQGFEDNLTYHELRYINTLWTDANKERYRRVDDKPKFTGDYKLYKINHETSELTDETDYYDCSINFAILSFMRENNCTMKDIYLREIRDDFAEE